MANGSAEADRELERFIDRYTPEIAAVARDALRRMRARLPGAVRMVYDNYNALAIGFAPNDRPSDAIFSIALFPRHVSLFFLRGAGLPDPAGLLRGSGKVARHVVLETADLLDSPGIRALFEAALEAAGHPFASAGGRTVIRSVSARQRPRRPKS